MARKPIIPSYPRAPSCKLRELLTKGEFLAPIIDLSEREKQVENDKLFLDVHLRPQDQVHVYCGLTRIVGAQLKRNGTVDIFADSAYKSQDCSENLFGNWSVGDIRFLDALNDYIDRVNVNKRHTNREGKIQTTWSRVLDPWIPFDREGVLSYKNEEQSKYGRKFEEVERALSLLMAIAERPGRKGVSWAKPSGGGRELDQLAIDSEGNLVLIEVKDASANSGAIFYAPLQLLQYVHEWRHAFGWLSVSRDLQETDQGAARDGPDTIRASRTHRRYSSGDLLRRGPK